MGLDQVMTCYWAAVPDLVPGSAHLNPITYSLGLNSSQPLLQTCSGIGGWSLPTASRNMHTSAWTQTTDH